MDAFDGIHNANTCHQCAGTGRILLLQHWHSGVSALLHRFDGFVCLCRLGWIQEGLDGLGWISVNLDGVGGVQLVSDGLGRIETDLKGFGWILTDFDGHRGIGPG